MQGKFEGPGRYFFRVVVTNHEGETQSLHSYSEFANSESELRKLRDDYLADLRSEGITQMRLTHIVIDKTPDDPWGLYAD